MAAWTAAHSALGRHQAHLEVSVNDPLLVAVLDCRHYLDKRDATLTVVTGAES